MAKLSNYVYQYWSGKELLYVGRGADLVPNRFTRARNVKAHPYVWLWKTYSERLIQIKIFARDLRRQQAKDLESVLIKSTHPLLNIRRKSESWQPVLELKTRGYVEDRTLERLIINWSKSHTKLTEGNLGFRKPSEKLIFLHDLAWSYQLQSLLTSSPLAEEGRQQTWKQIEELALTL